MANVEKKKKELYFTEHVVANVEKKLDELYFLSTQTHQIIDDIFGGSRTVPSGSLCESKTNDNKVSEMKESWEEIEKKYTRNSSKICEIFLTAQRRKNSQQHDTVC